jgi:hypothetical protein
MHAPHPMQSPESTAATPFTEMAVSGHASMQDSQPVHRSLSTSAIAVGLLATGGGQLASAS